MSTVENVRLILQGQEVIQFGGQYVGMVRFDAGSSNGVEFFLEVHRDGNLPYAGRNGELVLPFSRLTDGPSDIASVCVCYADGVQHFENVLWDKSVICRQNLYQTEHISGCGHLYLAISPNVQAYQFGERLHRLCLDEEPLMADYWGNIYRGENGECLT